MNNWRDRDWLNAEFVDDDVSYFNFIFMSVINKHLPWKRPQTCINSTSWATSEFLSMVDRHEYLFKLYNKCPCQYQAKS